ncbi:MAG: type II/IV secretion system protein [Candidatus Omnitrophica bacterium]|nr:type II/IV secretion system protein [Candidatus Omnitrophota bacterium]
MKKLGEILFNMGALTKDALKNALERSNQTGKFLGEILLKDKIISEEQLLKALGEQLHMEYVDDLSKLDISDEVVKAVPVKLVWHYKFMPVSLKGNDLKIVISDPFKITITEDLKLQLGYNTQVLLATEDQILDTIGVYYGVGAGTVQKILENKGAEKAKERESKSRDKINVIDHKGVDASVIKLVDQIIAQAIEIKATDLHFETYREKVIIRARVDGILADLSLPEDIKYLYPAMVSRIKIISGLDVVEKKIPQDGRLKLEFGGAEVDLRVSVIPASHGENIVIRLLPANRVFKLDELGFSGENLQKIKRIIQSPVGIIFLAGPTGSGKTTTLYAGISEIRTPKVKILTIEDPVEYEIEDVMQIQVAPKRGLTFAECLRSVLRHDPDVIMVGEVRDKETASLAIRSAMTGHLIFSTVHTNDATSGVDRLIDMGVEPFLLVSSLRAIIGQRLVRVICDKCKTKRDISIIKAQGLNIKKHYAGDGCEACRFTGYNGRVAIYELFELTNDIKEMIIKGASSVELRNKARKNGMTTMREDGWLKVEAGITTVEEILRVTEKDEDEEKK